MESILFVSNEAALKLRNTAQAKDGKVSIYELPLDVAHMLRGLSNRQEIFSEVLAPDPLKDLLKKLEEEGHTGSVEVITNKGTAMILLVRGRFSNCYFETEAGVTFEKGEALNKIYDLLGQPETSARVFQSEFSPDHWKARHETHRARSSRLHELLVDGAAPVGVHVLDAHVQLLVLAQLKCFWPFLPIRFLPIKAESTSSVLTFCLV